MHSHLVVHNALIVRSELMRRGRNLSDIARACHVQPSLVSRVVNGMARSRRIERYICKVTGLSHEFAFPRAKRMVRGHKLLLKKTA